jgi:hypothetical protein
MRTGGLAVQPDPGREGVLFGLIGTRSQVEDGDLHSGVDDVEAGSEEHCAGSEGGFAYLTRSVGAVLEGSRWVLAVHVWSRWVMAEGCVKGGVRREVESDGADVSGEGGEDGEEDCESLHFCF